MINRTIRSLMCGALALSTASCGLFSNDKILPEGERISVLSSETEIKPDYDAGFVKIKLPRPYLNKQWAQNGGNATHVMSHLQSGNTIDEFWTASFGEGASKRDFLIAAPVVAHQVVFAIDADAKVTARRLDDGEHKVQVRVRQLVVFHAGRTHSAGIMRSPVFAANVLGIGDGQRQFAHSLRAIQQLSMRNAPL